MAINFTGEKEQNLLVEKGDYEVIAELSWRKPASGGEPYINVAFHIRDDVDQKYAKRIIWDPIYRNKKTGELQTNKINGLLSTIKESERKKSFNDYDELIQYLSGKPLKITVEISNKDFNDPNSEKKNTVKMNSYMPTEYPEVKSSIAGEENIKPNNVGFTTDDLPF